MLVKVKKTIKSRNKYGGIDIREIEKWQEIPDPVDVQQLKDDIEKIKEEITKIKTKI